MYFEHVGFQRIINNTTSDKCEIQKLSKQHDERQMPKSKTTCVQAKLIDNHTCDDTLATKYGNTKINKRHDETTKTKHLAATIYNKIPCITPPIDSRPPALYVYNIRPSNKNKVLTKSFVY